MNPQLNLFESMTAPMNPFDRFYNTTGLEGDKLKQRQIKVGSQNEAILNFFRNHPDRNFTPDEVWTAMMLPKTPLTSIRRAITDLTKLGYLIKTPVKRMGIYGIETGTWKIK
jgi:hypothetical protein